MCEVCGGCVSCGVAPRHGAMKRFSLWAAEAWTIAWATRARACGVHCGLNSSQCAMGPGQLGLDSVQHAMKLFTDLNSQAWAVVWTSGFRLLS